MYKIIASVLAAASVAGCAQNSRQVSQSYVATASYANYSCSQLSSELQRISRRATELSGVQDENARADAIKVGIAAAGIAAAGIGLAAGGAATSTVGYYPLSTSALTSASYATTASGGALSSGAAATMVAGGGVAAGAGLFVHGNDANTNQISLLKGEMDAAERTFIAQDCNNPMRVIRARG